MNILVGYEVEGYFPFDSGKDAARACPVKVDSQCEGSLYDHFGGRVGSELVTRPKPAAAAMADIVKIFEWMRKTKARTTQSCGLHINVGAPGTDPSWMTVIGLSRSREVAKKFGRQNNQWCEDDLYSSRISEVLARQLPESLERLAAMTVDKDKLGEVCARILKQAGDKQLYASHSHSKRLAVVKRKSSHGPYFEFRTPGGANYHKRDTDVLWATKVFIKAVEGACA